MMRTRTLLTICFLLPWALNAQQSATATQNPISESTRGFGYFGSWLMAAFDSIPANQYSYSPTPQQQSVGFIAQHLEKANYQLCARFGERPWQMTSQDSLPEATKAAWPKDTLVAHLKASMIFCRDAMNSVTDARLAEELPANNGPAGRRAPRARFVLLFLTDLAEHYSQVASYMRILGLVPPSALPTPSR